MTSTVVVGHPQQDWDSPVDWHPLSYLQEGAETTVGRPETGSYCVLPADGAALLRELERGISPRRAAEWYRDQFGENVDIEGFLQSMDELGFVAHDESVSAGAARSGRGRHRRSRSGVRWQRLGAEAFSPLAWLIYAVLLVGAVVMMVRRPELAPHYEQLFFSRYLSVLEIVVFLGQLPFLMLHEMFHALAGRRLGLPSSFHIGHRLYYLVFETSLDGLIGVPRAKRYLPMLAGMVADLLVIAILTLLAGTVGTSDDTVTFFGGVCLALAFGTLLRFLWQFYFFLHTDLYYVVTTVFGCVNLQRTARQLLANRGRRLLRRTARLVDETSWHPRDRAVAGWYSWLLLVGYAAAIAIVPLVALPTVIRVVGAIAENLSGQQSAILTVDGILFLVVNLAQLALVVALVLRDRRRRRPASTHLDD